MSPAIAQQDVLTHASVYNLLNRVQLLLRNQSPRPAKKSDMLVPQDAIETAVRSRAELLFNEGSLARIGANALFRFVPGLRRFQLRNGTTTAEAIFQIDQGIAMIATPPDSVGTTVQTPQSRIEIQTAAAPVSPTSRLLSLPIQSNALIIQHNPALNTTQVFALTNSNIAVSNLEGKNTVFLQGGQTVSIMNGMVGPVQEFDLKTFYKTSQLAAGLGPNQEALVKSESPQVQETLNAVRVQTLAAVNTQARSIGGLCTVNAQGRASTLSSNCITTDSNDPLRDFQDHREQTTPRPPEKPPTPPDGETSVPTQPVGTPVLPQRGGNSIR
ncbi:MAG: hypothetical protein NVS2B14_03730 [Chamaesiphon sp.]